MPRALSTISPFDLVVEISGAVASVARAINQLHRHQRWEHLVEEEEVVQLIAMPNLVPQCALSGSSEIRLPNP